MRITRASVEDAEEILALTKRAFAPSAERYADPELPPLVESLESHRARYDSQLVLKAVERGRIVGSVQGSISEDGTCHVGRLVVEPDCQGRGIGRGLAVELEARFPEARRFELFTGHLSEQSLGLYDSLGYREFRREPVHDRLTLVWLEKAHG